MKKEKQQPKRSEAFESLMRGLNQAVSYEKGDNVKGVRVRKPHVNPVQLFPPNEIRKIRMSLDFSQALFAMSLGVSLKTVEAWESGKNVPSGPALRMIEMLKDDPDVLLKYNIIASA